MSQQFPLTEEPDNLSETFYFFQNVVALLRSSILLIISIRCRQLFSCLLFYCNGNRPDIGWNNNNDKIRGKQVWTFLVIIVGVGVNCLQVSSNFFSTVNLLKTSYHPMGITHSILSHPTHSLTTSI